MTTHPTAPPLTSTRRPTAAPTPAGPTARLVALPQLTGGLPAGLADVDAYLADLENARQSQLDAVPEHSTHVVTTAYARTVSLLLAQARAARRRIREGTYGRCTRCGSVIGRQELETRPWQPTCPTCPQPQSV